MRISEPISAERLMELINFRKTKWPGFEFQRFLCVWLRSECGFSTEFIAKTVGWHVNTVRFTQKDFIKRGVLALIEGRKGGRYRSLMTKDEEKEFLPQFDEAVKKGTILYSKRYKKSS